MAKRRRIEVYNLAQSPLVGVRTQRRLADVIGFDLKALKALAAKRQEVYWTKSDTINGKKREIACPIGKMRLLHDRIKNLLNRIVQPNYLYSPRHGRSPSMNAAAHLKQSVALKVDVRQFYPSTTDEHVFQFLHHDLNMASDVAGLLTKLSTFDGRLPFGSPLSPILCTLVHRDMFDRMNAHCSKRDDRMTLWVDDITISGQHRSDMLLSKIKGELARKGLQGHKIRRFRIKSGVNITGARISARGIEPANHINLKVKAALEELNRTQDSAQRLALVRSLIGLQNHMATVYAADHPVQQRISSRKAWLHQERRRLERTTAVTLRSKVSTDSASIDETSVPI